MNEQPYKLPKDAPLWVRNSSIAKQKEWHEAYNAKKKAYRQTYNQTPEYKAKQKAYMKAYYQTPEYKAYIKAYRQTYSQTPEYKAKQKARMKAYRSKIRQDKHCLEFFQAMNTASEIARNAQTTNQ